MREKNPNNLDEGYKKALDLACIEPENLVLKNSNTQKSEYAISKIFELAHKDLFMFSGDLSHTELRSETYILNMISFLKKDVNNKINVILERDIPNSESLNILKILQSKELFKEKISLRILNSNASIKKTKKGEKFHFLSNPEKGIYRLEYNIEERKALLNLEDYDYSKKLTLLFNEYKETSQEIKTSIKNLDGLKDLENEIDNIILAA